MKTIKGNIMNVTKGIIIHQVNNKHVMGAGLAKQIRAKYPQHYNDYMHDELKLGYVIATKINNQLGIFGMIAQNGYGRNKRYTDYSAFADCLTLINRFHKNHPNTRIYMPYGIGCGLAGGDWVIIEHLIQTITPYVILVKL